MILLNLRKPVIPASLRSVVSHARQDVLWRTHPTGKRSALALESLRRAYSGRCFIMGNGPSLNSTPLERLDGEYVWGQNKCYLLFDRIDWRPQFHIAIDSLVIPDIAGEIASMAAANPAMQIFLPFRYFCNGTVQDAPNIVWFRERQIEPQKTDGYFSRDAASFVRGANTVTISALQMAAHLGFNPIYLIGCDTNYQPIPVEARGEAKDVGTGETIAGFELISLTDNDVNHFDASYFGKGAAWHAPNVAGMLHGYERARQAGADLGIEILNATVGGQLEVFPRADIHEVLSVTQEPTNDWKTKAS